jgi:hypothetical protein
MGLLLLRVRVRFFMAVAPFGAYALKGVFANIISAP